MSDRPLTPKQEAFVREYLVDKNATQAAIRAGYSAKTAAQQGHQLLEKTSVAAAIAVAVAGQAERTKVSADYVLTRLVENVERAMQAEPVLDKHGAETGEYVYQGSVANQALQLIGKHLGMFAEKHEVTGANGQPIAHALTVRFVAPAAPDGHHG